MTVTSTLSSTAAQPQVENVVASKWKIQKKARTRASREREREQQNRQHMKKERKKFNKKSLLSPAFYYFPLFVEFRLFSSTLAHKKREKSIRSIFENNFLLVYSYSTRDFHLKIDLKDFFRCDEWHQCVSIRAFYISRLLKRLKESFCH